MNQTDLVSVDYLLSGNMTRSILTRDGSICYGHFDESNRSGGFGTYSLEICLVYSDPGW